MSRDDFLSFPVPPLTNQRESVVRALAALDDKIDNNRRLTGLLEETATTLFRARFVDFVGVDEFVDSAVGPIPTGWRVGTLGNMVEIAMGQSPPGSTYTDDPADGVLMVQGMGGFGARYPTSATYTSAPTKHARAGATLMTVRAPVGAVNVARTDLCVGRGVAALGSDRPAFTEFLIRSLGPRWAREESGTIFPAVNRTQIRDLAVVVPPDVAMDEFERCAAPLVQKLAANHDESETLTAVRDALLPKLISSSIRVQSNADRAGVIQPMADGLVAS